MCVGVSRIGLQYLPIDSFCLADVAGLVALTCDCKHFLDGGHEITPDDVKCRLSQSLEC